MSKDKIMVKINKVDSQSIRLRNFMCRWYWLWVVSAMLSGTNPRVAGLEGQLQAAIHVALECEVLLLETGCLVR